MEQSLDLQELNPVRKASAADRIFDAIYRQVVTLELPPGARLSEADVAQASGVSRQPVRDAFGRLAQLGFLQIRPQRATTVSPISVSAVRQARFVRTALEIETIRVAAETFGPAELAELDKLMAGQARAAAAADREAFHALDDEFHRRVCMLAGLEFAWALIREHKAHMDRVRFLSLGFGADLALEEHRAIVAAVRAGDVPAAVAAVRLHLSRIEDIIARIRADGAVLFAEED
jgi:DNA-binding GntR family transcriptional regulator